MIKFMEDLHTLLTQQTCEPAYELKELDQQLQNKTKYEQKQILINYVEQNGIPNPDKPSELEIELNNNSEDYYFFRLSYDGLGLKCHMYSDVYEEDWESCITYHEKFEDEEN